MKIAVFHNFLDNIGGAEIVALTLARGLEADVYTTNINEDKIEKMGFADLLPRITSIGKLPINAPFRQQLAVWKFRHLNLGKKYDFYIIAGDWAMAAAVHHKPNLWYIHSPLNELWQFKNYIREKLLPWWQKPLFDIFVWFNRKLSLRYAKHVERWVCNSQNTQKRVVRYYNKTPKIIHPPVDTTKSKPQPDKNYWLSVNRLAPAKRVELQLAAFARLPDEKLIIVGSFEKGARQFESCKKSLEQNLPPNVKIIHWVPASELAKLYAECKGFITTAKDEDFGMTAVEAMAFGKPVIAPNDGGYRETIINGQTGLLLDELDPSSIAKAIKLLGQRPEFYQAACLKQALKFDTKLFIEKIKKQLAESKV